MSTTPVDTTQSSEAQIVLTSDSSAVVLENIPPPFKDELYASMNIEANATTTTGPYLTIDVQPDFRFILLQLIEESIRLFDYLAQYNDPAFTPASFVGYCLALIYGNAALNDVFCVRMTRSFYANYFSAELEKTDLLNLIAELHTPNVAFIYSFAGFTFNHDFGRFFPIQMFMEAHNIIADNEREYDAQNAYNQWVNTTLIEGPDDIEVTIGNILGAAHNGHNYDNWLTLKCRQLFNPIYCQSDTGRRIFTSLAINPVTTDEELATADIDPYTYGLNDDSASIDTTTLFLSHISGISWKSIRSYNSTT